jgi:hypothetical protein
VLFAAVHRSLLALNVVHCISPIWSLSAHSGHWPELALNASAVNDPTATLAVHCGNDFDAGFSPYQSTRLSR